MYFKPWYFFEDWSIQDLFFLHMNSSNHLWMRNEHSRPNSHRSDKSISGFTASVCRWWFMNMHHRKKSPPQRKLYVKEKVSSWVSFCPMCQFNMQWIFLYGEEFNQAKTPYVVWSVKWSTIVQIQVYPLICSSENYAYIGIETKEFFFYSIAKNFLALNAHCVISGVHWNYFFNCWS